MSKQKKHYLSIGDLYEYEMLGICSHHNDYRLAFGINEALTIHLEKCAVDFSVTNKKGQVISTHSMYEFKDEENLIEYYLIKNKQLGKFLIPEKPAIDYFLFLCENFIWDLDELTEQLKHTNSILAVYTFNPEELQSTEHILFN